MNAIEKKLFWAVRLALLVVPLSLLCLFIAIYLTSSKPKFDFDWKGDYFNNWATPIVTGAALWFYARALKQSIEQNRLLMGQSVKPNWARLYENLKRDFEKPNSDQLDVPDTLADIHKKIEWLRANPIFTDDDGNISPDVFSASTYGAHLTNAAVANQIHISISVIHNKLKQVEEFVTEINKSILLDDDKRYFKLLIKDELVGATFWFMIYYLQHPSEIPAYIFLSATSIKYQPVLTDGLRALFLNLSKELDPTNKLFNQYWHTCLE